MVAQQGKTDYLSHSWFIVFRSHYWTRFQIVQNGVLEQYRVKTNAQSSLELPVRDFSAVRLGFIRVPIP